MHKIELEDVSLFGRFLDRLCLTERTRAGRVYHGFGVDTREHAPRKETLLGQLGRVEKLGQITDGSRYKLESVIATQNNERMGREGEMAVPEINLTDTSVDRPPKRVFPDTFLAIEVL